MCVGLGSFNVMRGWDICHRLFASCAFVKFVLMDEAENALRPCNRVLACGEYCVGPRGLVSASACMMFPDMCVNLTIPS